jgi:urease accessory protein
MSASASPSEAVVAEAAAQRRLLSIRARAGVRVEAHRREGRTRLAALAEHGGYRAKFPDVAGDGLEAVIINTGGGVVGGDRIDFEACAHRDAVLTVTSSTAERVYRSAAAASEISVTLTARAGSTLAWLPQPTILFSKSRFARELEADVEGDARLLIAETTVFGRIASGEAMGDGMLSDSWRVRRDGRLLFAEASRLDGEMQRILTRPAIAAGARCTALLLFVAPEAEDRLDAVREVVAPLDATIGVSAWNGQLVLRALASRLEVLQTAIRRAVTALGTVAVPASWTNGHE